MMVLRISFALVVVAGFGASAAEPRFIGQAAIPWDATDLSKESGELEGGTPANRLGSHGSGIAWTRNGTKYVMVPDRGPADGATSFRCRYQVVDIRVDDTSSPPVSVQLLETHLLTNRLGKPLVGSLDALPDADDPRGVRFDPEAIRMTSKGTLLIADEYGPAIGEFAPKGRQIDEIPIPSRYLCPKGAAKPEGELPPNNLSGRQPNRGLESLALSFDGNTIYTMTQGPLIQDGALDAENKRVGTNLRFLEIKRATGATREFLYQLDSPANGVNEIEVLSSTKFLVIERDGKAGPEAACKQIYEIDLRQATDISRIESLPATGTPKGVTPIAKRPFINLLDPALHLEGAEFPEKIEGLAIGPKLPDGSRVLLISSDNDFLPNQATRIYAFAVRTD